MAIKIGVSGFGRISRVVIRAAMDMPEIEIAGINVRNADKEYMVYMLKYDTVFGRFPKELDVYEDGIIIDGKRVPVYSESDAANIPWSECGAEYIVEGTGAYNTTEKAMVHINQGAKKVIITAPAKDKTTPTFVMGVNHDEYTKDMTIVSNASCTTNCLAPVCKVIEDNWGIEQGLMSTIHAATAKQKVVDARSLKDWRTGRSVFGNVIPSTIAYRVPTNDVSVIDVNIQLKESASYEEICRKIKEASEEGPMKGVIEYIDDEVVSSDFIADPHTSIFDAREGIQLNDKFFKLIAFYDNEYGYSTKVLELIRHMYHVDNADA